MTNNLPRVAIIGSGISGIASAAMLQKNGFHATVFEKSKSIGGVWALAYPNVRLQNIAEQYHISDFPWPFKPDLHPTGIQVMQYLSEAVRHFKLDLQLEHQVVSMQEEANGWLLGVQSPGGLQETHFDFVMVSSGLFSDGKNNVRFPEQERYKGRVITERELSSPENFKGKRVAVIGFGKSAVDMADFAAQQAGSQVFHIFRSPRWMFPRSLFGMHFSRIFFSRFGSVMMPGWSHPSGMARLMHRSDGFINTFWKQIEALLSRKILKRGKRLGPDAIKRLRQVIPGHDIIPDLRSAACLEPENYYAHLAVGKILPFHDEVEAFTESGICLKSGTTLDCDLVVLSLGSQTPAFPFMPAAHRDLLEAETDGVQLYRHLIHPKIPRLGFAGFNHGFLHIPSVEVGTLWLSALWKNELKLPSTEAMEQSIDYLRSWKRQYMHFEPSRSCGVNTRYQQYLDVLLQDLHLSPYRKLPNVVAEIFARYRSADYAHVLRDYRRVVRPGKILEPDPAMH